MREIKFRAWDKENAIMLPDKDDGRDPMFLLSTCLYDDDIVFMQYTGLQSKHGKLIFEGDIVRHYKNGDFERKEPIIGEVVMGPGYLNAGNWPISQEPEVIGNIYENPELCQQK